MINDNLLKFEYCENYNNIDKKNIIIIYYILSYQKRIYYNYYLQNDSLIVMGHDGATSTHRPKK